MTEKKKLSTAEVLEILKVKQGTLHHHMHLLRGLLDVSKDTKGRFEFTLQDVEIIKRHLNFGRRNQTPEGTDDVTRFQERIRQVQGVRRELRIIVNDLDTLLQGLTEPPTTSTFIHTLPLPNYRLVEPVRVLLYPHGRRFRASFPDARLQVEESTRENALLVLRADLLRAYLDLPPSPPTDDPQAADVWRVFHALIVPASRPKNTP
jgi:hypothetical protein